ncbi:MAG: hypothetical protein H6892_12010 [Brucellaceae bacterium]|nr:hypothetical protein [Brucellaceae bacterium]
MHAPGFRPMLFDLVADPQELRDVGGDPEFASIVAMMETRLQEWATRPSQRTTVPKDRIIAMRAGKPATGVLIGVYEADEISGEYSEAYRGKPGR